MKVFLFYHSVVSDWNNRNAHFLRGIVSSLIADGHEVKVMEPENNWSLRHLIMEQSGSAISDFNDIFPSHKPVFYSEESFDPDEFLNEADLVIVHEWNHPVVIEKIGDYKLKNNRFKLLFHDTHHRAVTNPQEMSNYDLRHYDGVLASGEVITKKYLRSGWTENAWTWHEAADTTVFHPYNPKQMDGDLVWIGNWGDDERTDELRNFIINPVKDLGLKAAFYGVRYPDKALEMLHEAGIEYKGWIPNYKVPEIFSRYRVTVHVPRKPYVTQLPGISTIRPFEALACGIPLVCSPWDDTEKLFNAGKDLLIAHSERQMRKDLLKVLSGQKYSGPLVCNGLNTILRKHTCDHRVNELMGILNDIEIRKTNTISMASS
jgi:spore maturation protein CgeB